MTTNNVDGRFESILLSIKAQQLMILVWGPGTRKKHYPKRKKIRDKLRAEFPNASVYFSESDELNEILHKRIPGSESWPLNKKEQSHLRACDLCVTLDVSKGAGEEIASSIGGRDGSKLFILTHVKYKNNKSFPAAIRVSGNQEFFTQKEYDKCNLVDRVIDRVVEVGFTKLIRDS